MPTDLPFRDLTFKRADADLLAVSHKNGRAGGHQR